MSFDQENDRVDLVEKWIYGVLGPCFGAVPGIIIIVRRRLPMPNRFGRGEFQGVDAVLWGVAILACMAAIHFHFFWGNQSSLEPYSNFGKAASICVLVVVVGFLLLRTLAP